MCNSKHDLDICEEFLKKNVGREWQVSGKKKIVLWLPKVHLSNAKCKNLIREIKKMQLSY